MPLAASPHTRCRAFGTTLDMLITRPPSLGYQNKLRRYIGYCPQDDALLDLLTVSHKDILRFVHIFWMYIIWVSNDPRMRKQNVVPLPSPYATFFRCDGSDGR